LIFLRFWEISRAFIAPCGGRFWCETDAVRRGIRMSAIGNNGDAPMLGISVVDHVPFRTPKPPESNLSALPFYRRGARRQNRTFPPTGCPHCGEALRAFDFFARSASVK
jgi:hypothetical protein